MAFGDKLRKLRREHKWSQDELGSRVGIHGRHIGKYETGQVMPNAEALIKMAKVFNVSVDFLLFDNEAPQPDSLHDQELFQLFNEVSSMGDKDQEVVKSLIDAYIKKRKMEAVLSR